MSLSIPTAIQALIDSQQAANNQLALLFLYHQLELPFRQAFAQLKPTSQPKRSDMDYCFEVGNYAVVFTISHHWHLMADYPYLLIDRQVWEHNQLLNAYTKQQELSFFESEQERDWHDALMERPHFWEDLEALLLATL